MYRTLFDLGPVSIHLYGVMLAVAFWLGIELSSRMAKRRDMDSTVIIDLGIVVLISSVVGSRALYVLTHLPEYRHDWLGVIRVWEGGLSFYGGLLAAVVFGIAFLRRKGVPVLGVTDIVAPQIALGVAIARIGCFLNGCCFGKASDLPWACSFPADSQAGWVMGGAAIHPTQIYSSIANLLIFVLLLRLSRRAHRDGVVFYSFLVAYGIWRFCIDFLRHYEANMYMGLNGLTWNQVGSIGLIATGLVLLLRKKAESKRAGSGLAF
jgi:phosphatidylglycerol:prolipoprotein diacylglycerol transferase